MNSKQLRFAIKCDRVLSTVVCGVFASDQIPLYISHRPLGLIVNTQLHDKPGKHWVSFYITDKNDGELFCSFGYSLDHYSSQFADFFTRNGIRKVRSNSLKLQSAYSMVCGHYALYYLLHRCRDISLQSIVQQFDESLPDANDEFVYHYIVNSFQCCL